VRILGGSGSETGDFSLGFVFESTIALLTFSSLSIELTGPKMVLILGPRTFLSP
jgi:hypothetical protein